jgi:hypothetical protein
MDPTTVRLVLRAGELTPEDMPTQIEMIFSSMGQLVRPGSPDALQRLHAGFAALFEAVRLDEFTREMKLDFALGAFGHAIGLDPAGFTGGRPNPYWIALAHLGLACVEAMRGSEENAARNLLQIYLVEPRTARIWLGYVIF